MTDSTKKTGKHGGARANAGRKFKYNEPTTLMRVPVSKKEFMTKLLEDSLADKANNVLVFPNPRHDLSPELVLRQLKVSTHVRLPIIQELMPAGFPSPAEDHIVGDLDLNEHLIRNRNTTFIATVGSLSMQGAGFENGDEILIDRSIKAQHKDIVVAMIDNTLSMMRLMLCEHHHEIKYYNKNNSDKSSNDCANQNNLPIWFKAENPKFDNIYPRAYQAVTIIGVITYHIKKIHNYQEE